MMVKTAIALNYWGLILHFKIRHYRLATVTSQYVDSSRREW